MPVLQVEAQISSDELLQAVKQLNPDELSKFVNQVLMFRAEQNSTVLSKTESDLLKTINEHLADESQARLHVLTQKRLDESLTPEEHQELLTLTAQAEALNVKRLEKLANLAQLRGVTLTQLMADLGLDTPSYVS